jgi:hypothetical protein
LYTTYSRVARGISRTEFTTNSGETDGDVYSLARVLEETSACDIRERMGRLEIPMGTCTLGMNYSLVIEDGSVEGMIMENK